MVGAVVQGGLQVHHRVAGQHTVDHGLPEALFHRGEVVLGHRAAHDLLAELHLLLLAGLKADPHVAELAVAAGLLLVPALDLHLLADLLPVGHAGGDQLGLHAEAGFQSGHQHVELDVAGAGEHHLTGLGVVDHGKGLVLLAQAAEAGSDLVVLALGLGLDGHGIDGLGESDGLQLHHVAGVAQGVAGLYLVHLSHSADVAAGELLHFLGLFAPDGVQPAQLLREAGAGVDDGHIRLDGAGEHLDVGVFAVLVGDCFPHKGGGHRAG